MMCTHHAMWVNHTETRCEELLTEVTVRVTGEDGSSSLRTTYWILENGEWLHRFSEEEIELFMPELSFEEFVEAQQ